MEAWAADLSPERLQTIVEDGEFVLCRQRDPTDTPVAVAIAARGDHAVRASAATDCPDAGARTLVAGRVASSVGGAIPGVDDARRARHARPRGSRWRTARSRHGHADGD